VLGRMVWDPLRGKVPHNFVAEAISGLVHKRHLALRFTSSSRYDAKYLFGQNHGEKPGHVGTFLHLTYYSVWLSEESKPRRFVSPELVDVERVRVEETVCCFGKHQSV
jgi:hypothetical protein